MEAKKRLSYMLLLGLLLTVCFFSSCYIVPGDPAAPDTSGAGADLTTVEEIPTFANRFDSIVIL